MDVHAPVAGPSRPARQRLVSSPGIPIVSSVFDADTIRPCDATDHWLLHSPSESANGDGVSLVMAEQSGISSRENGDPATLPTRNRFPTRIARAPRLLTPGGSARALSARQRYPVQASLDDISQDITLLSNALKLNSLAVCPIVPPVHCAPVVTISSYCRPDPRVVFDQHCFTSIQRSRKHEPNTIGRAVPALTQAQQSAFDTSQMTIGHDLNSSNGESNTISSPSSSVAGLPIAGTPASSLMADASDQAAPSSPPARRSNAWVKPRSWADLATHMGGASVHAIASFSEQLGESRSTPNRSPAQSVTSSPIHRGRINGDAPSRRLKADKNTGVNGSSQKSLSALVMEAETRFTAPLTYPRGIINTGNMCFANAILQALLFCAPFFNLFRTVGQHVPHDFHNSTPLVEAVIQFLEEFHVIPDSVQADLTDAPALAADSLRALQAASEPFIPDLLYDAMKLHKRFDSMRRGHQEDAEEFLGFFLDTLHEELQAAIAKAEARLQKKDNSARSSSLAPTAEERASAATEEDLADEREVKRPASPSEGDGWLEVGQKGKTSFTRTTSTSHSPVTRIFGGKLRSVLRTPGSKDSVTLEPYQPLQLDIQPAHVTTIEDALENLTMPETIPGVMTSSKHLVDATKQVFIETLPSVLVLHLKRFVYDDIGGVQKSSKILGYGPTLEISESIISPARRGEVQRRYKLFAVVYHHGRFATGGHYTVDVLRQDHSEWLHIDDTTWTSAPPPSSSGTGTTAPVASSNASGTASSASRAQQQSQHSGSAYLLFYAREDALQQGMIPRGAQGDVNGVEHNGKMSTNDTHAPARKAHVTSAKPGATPASPIRAQRRGVAIPGAPAAASAHGSTSARVPRSRTTSAQP